MRLTIFLLTAAFLNVSANGLSQTITYTAREVPFEKVFPVIEQQTGLVVFCNAATLKYAGKVSVQADKMPLADFLDLLLKNTPLEYTIKNRTIFIFRKSSAETLPAKPAPTIAQPISGVVRGPDGQPLSGVSITVKGTKKGTTTSGKGGFTLDVKEGDVLVISNIGYQAVEYDISPAVMASSKNMSYNVSITLSLSSSPLDEVQIIAYGETSKRYQTGNVTSVKAKDIEKQPVQNPLLALQGRVPGVIIEQSTGLPGSGVTIRIQGQNSLASGNDPLYVIDGVPYTSQLLPSLIPVLGLSGSVDQYRNALTGNPLSFIDPASIESIDILKDADATAIYGSRAANGAVLITTKKGKAGKISSTFNVQYGWGQAKQRMDLLNTKQYLDLRHEALLNSGFTTPGPTDYDVNGTWDSTRDVDWQKEFFGNTSQYMDTRATVSGGSANTNFLLGVGYHRETTVFPGNFADEKGSVHFNINSTSLNQKFRVNFSGNYMMDDNRLPPTDLTATAMRLSPNAPALYDANGNLNWAPLDNGASTWRNPLSNIQGKFNIKTNNLVASAQLSYEFIQGLELKGSLGYTNMMVRELSTAPLTSQFPEDRYLGSILRGSNFGNNQINSWIIEPQLKYRKHIWEGKFEMLVGTSVSQKNIYQERFSASGFLNDLVLEDIGSAATVDPAPTIMSTYRYNAVFGRINYTWRDKLILNLNARRDGSSRFGSKNLFQNFGSVGAAWIFSNENFLSNFSALNFGKLRASYGTTGNDQIGDYMFMDLYTTPLGANPYQNMIPLAPERLTNPYLQWEETRKLQLGLDLGFFRDRILFNATYYTNRSSNQLQPYALPLLAGFNSIILNFPALVQNSGWELSLNTVNIKSSAFTWSSSLNITIPRNKLVEFPGIEQSSASTIYVVGKPITIARAYKLLGVNRETGVYQFADKDGKPVETPDYTTDMNVIINLAPKYYGGFQNSFRYKGFQLDALLQFVKQTGPNTKIGALPGNFYGTANYGNQPRSVLDRWQKPGDIKSIQRFSSDYSVFFSEYYAGQSDFSYSDASYIRLKNISISWDLPVKIGKAAILQSARLYLQAQNLFTITNYPGMDPETKNSLGLPPLRIMVAGVQFTL